MSKGILLIVIIAVIYLFWKSRKNHREKQIALKITNKHHAVSIEHGLNCCAQVEKLESKRFLSKEAPTLPLEGCDQEHCQCRYRHHDDRRQSFDDRRDSYGLRQQLYNDSLENERRKKRDRRQNKSK